MERGLAVRRRGPHPRPTVTGSPRAASSSLTQRAVRDASSAPRVTGPQLVLAIGAVVAAISGVYLATVLMARSDAPEPPAELFRDAPLAAGNGVELYVAELVPGNSPVPMDPPGFGGQLATNEPISLRLVYLADEALAGDDLVILWTREDQELRRSRIVLRSGRSAGSAVLSGTRTGEPGTYQVDILVEDTPLTAVRFEVIEDAAA